MLLPNKCTHIENHLVFIHIQLLTRVSSDNKFTMGRVRVMLMMHTVLVASEFFIVYRSLELVVLFRIEEFGKFDVLSMNNAAYVYFVYVCVVGR